MDISLIFPVAFVASFIVVVLVLVTMIIYQRWRIGDIINSRKKYEKIFMKRRVR